MSYLYQDLLFEEQHCFPPLPLLFPGVGSVHHGNGRNKSTCFDNLELLSFQVKHKNSICLWLQSPLLFSSSAVTSQ